MADNLTFLVATVKGFLAITTALGPLLAFLHIWCRFLKVVPCRRLLRLAQISAILASTLLAFLSAA